MTDSASPSGSGLTGTSPLADDARWLSAGVRGIGTASFLADVGHEIPTALLPDLLTKTLGAPASALGFIEGVRIHARLVRA